jgi:hypothetical protein
MSFYGGMKKEAAGATRKPGPVPPEDIPASINRALHSAEETNRLFADLRDQHFIGAGFSQVTAKDAHGKAVLDSKGNKMRIPGVFAFMETRVGARATDTGPDRIGMGHDAASGSFITAYPLQDLINAKYPGVEDIAAKLQDFYTRKVHGASTDRRPISKAARNHALTPLKSQPAVMAEAPKPAAAQPQPQHGQQASSDFFTRMNTLKPYNGMIA